ncbi:MAG TPA: PEGA domain-containing protein [Kofleriaceae bacterium]|nr:PEGA domain-containing protein [Kofleriaceae bacterium]
MGAPIYLVSACASGEEFVAAFRRYADKNGLFIPIGDPLPPGSRSRFAVTLRDGGVMVEGEAEIVSSGRAPSVLHGRVGMTLRFVQPDDASRTTLSELEKARLAMKPAPPSVPPRPADIPAEPRPVPPPVQGRIDAVNALAECVAIGDVSGLGAPLPPVALPPPKPGPRFVMPAIPAARTAPGTSPPGTLGVAPRPAPAPRPSTAPLPIAVPRPDDRAAAEPPAVTPRATPQPDRLRSAERTAAPDPVSGLSRTMTAIEVAPGPASDTMVAVSPPATLPAEPSLLPEASGRFDRGPMSATMTAVPVPSPNPPSAPTVIGGPVVPVDDDDSGRTQIHAGAPRPTPPPPGVAGGAEGKAPRGIDTAPLHADARPTLPPFDVAQTLRDPPVRSLEPRPGPQVPVTMHGMPLELRPPAPPLHADLEITEPTDISMPPEPPSSPSAELPTEPAPSTDPEAAALASAAMPSIEPEAALVSAATPSAEIDAPALAVDEAPSSELPAEPSGPQSIEPAPEDPDAPPRPPSVQIETLEIQESDAITHELSAEPEPDAAAGRPRRTVVGVAVQPTGVLIPPAPATRRAAIPAAPAGPDEPTTIRAGDPAIDAAAPTVPPGSDQLSAAEPPLDEPVSAAPAAITGALPSGDWTIALDPAAPGGWSPPRHAVPRHLLAGIPAAPALAGPNPDDAASPTPLQRPSEMPAVEPKVQIDPTLIEPAHASLSMASSPDLAGSAPELAMYARDPGHEAVEAPALHMMMAVPQPGPYAPQHGSPMHGGPLPGYPLEPPYARMPGGLPPGVVSADASAFGAVRYPPMPSQVRRRHLVIMLVTAVVAVLLGIAAMLLFRRPTPPVSPGAQGDDRSGGIETPSSGEPARGPDSPPPGDPAAAPPGAAPAAAVTTPPGTPASPGSGRPDPAHAAAPAAAPGACYADVSSVPAGAEIVLDQASVIGTTPQRVALPCGHPVELLVRKPHLVPSTHTITPTPEGTAVQFVLVRQTFLVKVSSTPPGATVTLGGKSLGVTPTMVKVPAFESSTLSIARDGYETESETVAPRGNGTAVHTVLRKAEHKKPR